MTIPATPILEILALSVYAALNTIIAGDTYHYTLDVERQVQQGNPVTHLKAVIYQETPEEPADSDNTIGVKMWRQPFNIEIYIKSSEDDTTPVDTYFNNVFSDLTLAVMTDPKWSGYAIDTFVRQPDFLANPDGSFAGFVFKFDIDYRTKDIDATQLP